MTRIVRTLFLTCFLLGVLLSGSNCYKYPGKKITVAEFLYQRLSKFAINRPRLDQVTLSCRVQPQSASQVQRTQERKTGNQNETPRRLGSLLHKLRQDPNIQIMRSFIRSVRQLAKTIKQSTKLTSPTSGSHYNEPLNDIPGPRPPSARHKPREEKTHIQRWLFEVWKYKEKCLLIPACSLSTGGTIPGRSSLMWTKHFLSSTLGERWTPTRPTELSMFRYIPWKVFHL